MDEHDRRMREQQLMIAEALVEALNQRDEVFRVIDESEDVNEAIHRVGQLLGVEEGPSRAVLDLQARRFTRDQRQALATHAEELRSWLADGP